MTLVPAVATAQPKADERDRSKGGAMTLAELRQEPVTSRLDFPFAGTDNPRRRLDLYLPRDRKSAKLPVIVFVHSGG